MARVVRGNLVPHRLSPDDRTLTVAGGLCDIYDAHLEKPRSGLEQKLTAAEEELGPRIDARRGFRIVRALAKLLEERSEWISPTDADPYTVRTRIFELASALPEFPSAEPGLLDTVSRNDVLSQVSRETSLEDPVSLMYADRQSAQLLGNFEKPSPEALIERYNVAQVQGVLYSARELTLDLGAEADAGLVFHYVKLFGLIYRVEPTTGGYHIHLDGPLSLFSSTRKYGLRLAKLLPGLLLTSPWTLSASIEWKDRDAVLNLDSESGGLRSHYAGPGRDDGEDDAREAFGRAWERAKDTGDWELREGASILPLPGHGTALVPDFTLTNSRTGERVYLEVLGFWSERRLVERVALIREAASRGNRVVAAASEKLGTSSEALEEAVKGGVIPFKGRLNPKDVLAALDSDTKK